MKGIWTTSGIEAETNDGKVKYILSKVTSLSAYSGIEQYVYKSSVFFRNNQHIWEQTVDSGTTYTSLKEFLNQISHIPEMSKAYNELSENKK